MPCYHPLQAFRRNSGRDNETTKWPITFKRTEGYTDQEIILPCGRCTGCRLERARVWAHRCMDEASLYNHNVFITPTYDNDHLPEDNNLNKEHLQKFWKRLRKYYGKLRYYACGEYGDSTNRPHYHAIVFGLNITDKIYHSHNNGNLLYKSKTLDKIWGHGHCLIGSVTIDSCGYVARYIMKKVLGKDALYRYTSFDPETGEIFSEVVPEFTTMSRKPAIGINWLKKYKNDVYENNGMKTIKGGISFKAPRAYDTYMEKINGTKFINKIKAQRKGLAEKFTNPKHDTSLTQLAIEETVKLAATQTLTRNI